MPVDTVRSMSQLERSALVDGLSSAAVGVAVLTTVSSEPMMAVASTANEVRRNVMSRPSADPAVALMRFKPKVPALGSIAQTDPG